MDDSDVGQRMGVPTPASDSAKGQPDTVPTLQDAIVKRRLVDMLAKPNQRYVDSLVLRRSSKQATYATHIEIINQKTGDVHHHAVKLEVVHAVAKSKGGGWSLRAPLSLWIDDDGDDAIGKLRDFLSIARGDLPEEVGDFLVVRLATDSIDSVSVRRLIEAASSSGKTETLVQAVEAVSGDPDALDYLAELAAAHPDASKVAAAALNFARYNNALAKLDRLIEEDAAESEFQALLTNNAWIFGSEYSELHPRRVWIRDQQKDFMLRRAADDYLEVIEIKTPLADKKLFLLDESHACLYPRSELSKAVAQVMSYLEELDASRDNIERRDGERINKIAARIIIGRNHDQEQVDMLRRFNSHLDRIEVLTFDQLLKIGHRVAHHIQHVVKPLQDGGRASAADTPV